MELKKKGIAARLHQADQLLIASNMERSPQEIIVKYFAPWGAATWWITTATPLDEINGEPCDPAQAKDWHMFGFVTLGLGPDCDELGYTLLSELQKLSGPFGLKVERDLHYAGHQLAEVMQT